MNPQTYFTSDLHLGEENIITYSKRPFKDVEHMHRVLINNYNSTVKKHDICYFLGDLGLPKSIKEIVPKLNGTKIIILGNHDKKGKQFWFSCGFVAVLNSASMVVAGERVTMSHCPLMGVFREDVTGMRGSTEGDNWHKEAKHGKKHSYPDFGQFHLQGHTHKKKSEVKYDRQWDIGVDGNGHRPVSLSQVESWIALYKKDKDDKKTDSKDS